MWGIDNMGNQIFVVDIMMFLPSSWWLEGVRHAMGHNLTTKKYIHVLRMHDANSAKLT